MEQRGWPSFPFSNCTLCKLQRTRCRDCRGCRASLHHIAPRRPYQKRLLPAILPDRRNVVLHEKIVQGFGHQVLQCGVSAFPGLNQTQTGFEVRVKPCGYVNLPGPARPGDFGASAGAGKGGFVVTGSGAGEFFPVLCLSACCKSCIFDMWTFRLVDLFTNKLVEPLLPFCRVRQTLRHHHCKVAKAATARGPGGLRPILRTVEYSGNLNCAFGDLINGNVGQRREHQFPPPGRPATGSA